MGWLISREMSHQIFEDGVRWVEAIKHQHADPEAFACWAMHSPAHMDAFRQAWAIWHDLHALSHEQRECIEKLAQTH